MAEDTHLDKTGTSLAPGDMVELSYGGDNHFAEVTDLTRNLDVDHVELAIATHVTVPSGSVALRRKAPPAPKPQKEEAEPKLTTHRPAHRPARTTRRT